LPVPFDIVLDSELCAFVQQSVSIIAASRTDENRPCAARALGCKVLENKRLLVFLPKSRAQYLLDAIEDTGAIAVVFSEIDSHKTVQLKGVDAVVQPGAIDQGYVDNYCASYAKQLSELGYPASMASTLVPARKRDTIGVVFTPLMVFDQTPGPQAGRQLIRQQ